MLSDMKFLESLKIYDRDNIPISVMKKIRDNYITNPDFDPTIIRKVSSACEGICSWVRAIEVYDRVAKVTNHYKCPPPSIYASFYSGLWLTYSTIRNTILFNKEASFQLGQQAYWVLLKMRFYLVKLRQPTRGLHMIKGGWIGGWVGGWMSEHLGDEYDSVLNRSLYGFSSTL